MSLFPILFNIGPSHDQIWGLLMQIRRYDPNAVLIQQFVGHVRVYNYTKSTSRWNDYPFIEGWLIAYQGKKTIEDVGRSDYYAFIVLNAAQSHIQRIDRSIVAAAKALNLFYLATINDTDEVFCLHFDQQFQCQILDHIFQLSILQTQLMSEIEHQVVQRSIDDANSQTFINSIQNSQNHRRTREASSNHGRENDIRTLQLKQILKIDDAPEQQILSTVLAADIAPALLSAAAYVKTNSSSVSSFQLDANRSLSEWNCTGGASSEMVNDRTERSDINGDDANL